MPDIVRPIHVTDLRRNRLQVAFAWSDDRYAHIVSLLTSENGEPTRILQSIEGTAEDAWPPSPPVQQLVPHHMESGETFLGVGQAGTAHWSLSVEPLPKPVVGYHFELACRVTRGPEYIGSRLQMLLRDVHWTEDFQGVSPSLNTAFCGARLRLAVEADCSRLTWESSQPSIVNVLPFENHGQQGVLPRTIRWAYRLTLELSP